MKRWPFVLEAVDDLVFSAAPASVGGHATLAYVPGAALRGWAAARLYAALAPDEAWLAFHSGKLRFGCAFPFVDGEIALPMPLALHAPKAAAWRGADGRMDAEIVVNAADPEGARTIRGAEPYEPLREGFLTPSGRVVAPQRRLEMKTAIDPERGQAAEAQLFGYEALARGQRFAGTLAWDDDLPEALARRVQEAISGLAHLGRSRAAQYGRARIRPEDIRLPWRQTGPASERLILWALTDLALAADGAPITRPAPEMLGLPAGRLIAERSFIAVRRYAPYNQRWRMPEPERLVIAAGSVLAFELEQAVDPAGLPEQVGLWREQGLGLVWWQPPILQGPHPRFAAPPRTARAQAAPQAPDDPLIRWMRWQKAKMDGAQEAEARANALLAELQTLYATAKRLGAPSPGPGPAQWGRVRELAQGAASADALMQSLFDDDGAPCKEGDADWSTEGQLEGRFLSFRDWLRKRLKDTPSSIRADVAARLAQKASEIAQKEAR